MNVKFGKDEKGEFHEGYPRFIVQKDGKIMVLCPLGHIVAYDLDPCLIEYYRKQVRCHGKI